MFSKKNSRFYGVRRFIAALDGGIYPAANATGGPLKRPVKSGAEAPHSITACLALTLFLLTLCISNAGHAQQPATSPVCIDLRVTQGAPADRAGVEIRITTTRKVEGAIFVARSRGSQSEKQTEYKLVLPSLPLGDNRVSVRWEQLAAANKEAAAPAPAHFTEFDIVQSDGSPLPAKLVAWNYLSPLLLDLRKTDGVPADSAGVEIRLRSSGKIEGAVFLARGYQFRIMRESRLPLPDIAQGESTVRVRWEQLPSNGELIEPLSPIHFNELDIIAVDGSPLDAELVTWNYIKGNTSEPPAWENIKQRSFAPDADGWRPGIPSDGFGRFGWVRPSGLLVGSLHPDGFEVRAIDENGKESHGIWNVKLGSASVQMWERTQTDWTTVSHRAFYDYSAEMKNELAAKAPELLKSRRVPQRLLGSVLAPGFLIDSTEKRIVITARGDAGLSGTGDSPVGFETHGKNRMDESSMPRNHESPRLYIPTADGPRWIENGETFSGQNMSEGWLAAVWPGQAQIPILLVLKNRPVSVRANGAGVEIEFADSLDRIGVSYPAGYRVWRGDDAQLASASRKLAAIMRAYPDACTQHFKVSPDGASVEIRETFRHTIWENAWKEPHNRLAPIAPLLSFAAAQGYPVRLPEARTDMEWDTKLGPYAAVPGNELVYRLPVPEAGTRIYLRPAGKDVFAEQLAGKMFSASALREDIWLRTDNLRGWWLVAPTSLALPLFDAEQRDEFIKRWRWTLDHNLRPHTWYARTEPFSGARYPVSFGWLERHTWTLGDINSGVGAVLYGTWAYARSSGDWSLVAEKWPVLRGALEYFLVEHDWCQMQTGAREHSAASGIDMDGIGYEGIVAYTAMAETLGRDDDAALGRLLAARVAVPTIMRWLGQKWTNPGQPPAEWKRIGVGLSEIRGFDFLNARSSDPDHISSELALCLAWVGQYPELYYLHQKYLGDDFLRWFEYDYVENKIADWRKKYKGNRNNHPANVTAHLYMRALLGADGETLRDELKRQKPWGLAPQQREAQENAGFYSLLLGRDFPVSLVSWGCAGVKKAEYNSAKREAVIEFDSKDAFTLMLEVSAKPAALTLNGNVIKDMNINNNRLSLRVPAGESRIILQFP